MAVDSSIPWIVINLAFALLALGVGFVSGAFFYGGKASSGKSEESSEQEAALEKRIALERALLATGQLQDLATGLASDVGEHSECVQQISASLKQAEDPSGAIDQSVVTSALTQIVDANDSLQKKLEKAENQIQAQAQEIATYESEARTDSLTGLSNRRAFDDELKRRFAEWERKDTPFSLVILDVDHFKKFNDTHGHQAGDEVLRRVGEAMGSSARSMDIPCRYGGEEFAVVLPSTTLADATPLAERIRQAIGDLEVKHEGKTLSVKASLGVAQAQDGDDTKRLLRRADEALYEAKDAGRDRSYVNTQGENVPAAEFREAAAESTAQPAPTRLLDKLPNRTIFANQLTQRVAESHRGESALALMVVRIEGFSSVNSQYGEVAAIVTLDSVAQFLQSTLREMDTLARVAEDRFAVMLPGATSEVAQRVAERASKALSNCAVPVGKSSIKLDARITVSSIKKLDTATHLMERAEAGLALATESESPLLV